MAIHTQTPPMTGPQAGFLKRLTEERDATHASGFTHETILNVGTPGTFVSKQEAHEAIDDLLTMPRKGGEERDGEPYEAPPQDGFDTDTLTKGVYMNERGTFVVQISRQSSHPYAKKIQQLGPYAERLNEVDGHVGWDFEYAPGEIRFIRPEHKVTKEQAQRLSTKYGVCLKCGKFLKAAKSVERSVGPVCWKSFA